MENKLWTKDFIFAFLANLLISFAFYLLMPTLPFYLLEELDVNTPQVGVFMSLYVIAVLTTRPFSGYFTDKFPRKTFYVIMLAFLAMCYGLYLISTSLLLFAAIRIMHGVSWSMATTAGSTMAIDILPAKRRGEGIGYYGLSMTLAMALGPMIGLFIHDNFSYTELFIAAGISSAIGLLFASMIKPRPKPIVESSKISLDRFFLTKAIPQAIVMVLITISYGFAVSYVALFGEHIKVSNTGLFFIFMALGTIISRFLSGKLIDKGHIISIIVVSLILLIFVLGGFIICDRLWIYLLLGFLSGIGYGAISPAFQTMILNLAPHNRRGTANSTYFTAFDLGIGVGILIGSSLISSIGYQGMYAIGTILNLLALIVFVTYVRGYYKKNVLIVT